jgi:rare lipoprotein A
MGTISGEHMCRAARLAAVAAACLTLAQCGSASKLTNRLDPKYGVSASPRVVQSGEAVPKGGGTFRVGRPYTVAGRLYVPEEDRGYSAEGLASWYGDDFHGRQTANGEVFDMTSISAAHPTLPMPSYARVTNLRNGKSLIVRVNDRGPFHANRVMDVSYRAATLLEFERSGTARVRVEYVGRASLDGSDDRQLMATLRTGQPAPAPSAVMVASARPFVPEIPSTARSAIRGDVPIPEGRPYTLGHTSADVASINATSAVSASRRPQTVMANSTYPRAVADYRDAEPAPLTRPVSAYAPARSDFTTGPISGRGLY